MIKGILFDKDGTLIDFFSIWPEIAKRVIPAFLELNGLNEHKDMEEDLFKSIGLHEGVVDPRGAFAYKSYTEISEDICDCLNKYGINMTVNGVYRQIKDMFNDTMRNANMKYIIFTDTPKLMENLREKGIRIGLATSDIEESAYKTLKELGIFDYFDYIGSDDGIRRPKPYSDMFVEFIDKTGLSADEIAVVGDTFNDMLFAKNNGGTAIGVLSGVSSRRDLEEIADYIIESVDELPGLTDRLNTDK